MDYSPWEDRHKQCIYEDACTEYGHFNVENIVDAAGKGSGHILKRNTGLKGCKNGGKRTMAKESCPRRSVEWNNN